MCYCSSCQRKCPSSAQTKHAPHSRDGSWASPSSCPERHEQMSKKDPFHVLAPLRLSLFPLSPAREGPHASPGRLGDIWLFPGALNQEVPSSAPCRGAVAAHAGMHKPDPVPMAAPLQRCPRCVTLRSVAARSVGLGRASCARASTAPGPLQTRA